MPTTSRIATHRITAWRGKAVFMGPPRCVAHYSAGDILRPMDRRLLVTVLILLASSALIPAAVTDPVRTDAGLLTGEAPRNGVRAFKGIPFGAPPVGNLRW